MLQEAVIKDIQREREEAGMKLLAASAELETCKGKVAQGQADIAELEVRPG